MAANLGTREMDYRFMMLITINHQVMHARKLARFNICFFLMKLWKCCYAIDLLQDVIRFDQQIDYASSASAWTDLSFSDHFAVSWAGAVAAVPTVQQCDFEGILLSICVVQIVFKNCEVSSSSPFPDFTPSRLEKVECFSFTLQLHCTRFMLQKMNRLNSNEMTFLKVEVEDGARLLIEKVLVSASAACGAKTLTASLELVQGYHYFESLLLCGFAQLLWFSIFLRAFRAANFTLGGLSFEDLTQKFHESIGSAVSQDRRISKKRYVCVYIYSNNWITHNYTS